MLHLNSHGMVALPKGRWLDFEKTMEADPSITQCRIKRFWSGSSLIPDRENSLQIKYFAHAPYDNIAIDNAVM